MFRKVLSSAFGVCLVVLLAGCSVFRNPNSPTPPPADEPPPDQSQYESLPTERHYLVDPSTGQATKMWARLISVSPPRGSGVTLGPEVCPTGCFRFSLEIGFETVENPHVIATIRVGWSSDGETAYRGFGGSAVKTGSSVMIGDYMISRFDDPENPENEEVPEYLLVEGSYWDVAPNQIKYGETGKTSFVLDYHLKEPVAGSR